MLNKHHSILRWTKIIWIFEKNSQSRLTPHSNRIYRWSEEKNRNGVSTYSNSSYRRICRCHRRPAKCQTPHVFAILADWHRPYWINATSADIRPFFTVSHSFAIRCINMPGLNNKVSRVKMQKKCEKCAKLITNQCWNNSTMCQLSIPYEILANYCENFV